MTVVDLTKETHRLVVASGKGSCSHVWKQAVDPQSVAHLSVSDADGLGLLATNLQVEQLWCPECSREEWVIRAVRTMELDLPDDPTPYTLAYCNGVAELRLFVTVLASIGVDGEMATRRPPGLGGWTDVPGVAQDALRQFWHECGQ